MAEADAVAVIAVESEIEAEGGSRWTRGHIPGEVGIWIFILGDMALYAALFGSFMVDRGRDVELSNLSSATVHIELGAINVMLLLTSSLLVALAVRAVREEISSRVAPYLFRGAIACALGFVVVKYFEYSDLLRNDLHPTENTFYTYYYLLTGIHLTHLLAGTAILVFLLKVAKHDHRKPNDIRAMENGASFWHVVDLLWIVLFALLYLVR